MVGAFIYSRFYAIACQLSPVAHSSGIQLIETDTFKLHCTQTQTGNYNETKYSYVSRKIFFIFQML